MVWKKIKWHSNLYVRAVILESMSAHILICASIATSLCTIPWLFTGRYIANAAMLLPGVAYSCYVKSNPIKSSLLSYWYKVKYKIKADSHVAICLVHKSIKIQGQNNKPCTNCSDSIQRHLNTRKNSLINTSGYQYDNGSKKPRRAYELQIWFIIVFIQQKKRKWRTSGTGAEKSMSYWRKRMWIQRE